MQLSCSICSRSAAFSARSCPTSRRNLAVSARSLASSSRVMEPIIPHSDGTLNSYIGWYAALDLCPLVAQYLHLHLKRFQHPALVPKAQDPHAAHRVCPRLPAAAISSSVKV